VYGVPLMVTVTSTGSPESFVCDVLRVIMPHPATARGMEPMA
jgi:hypothetical protein